MTPMENIRVPDKVGETRKAWRAWKLSIENGEIVLRSINQKPTTDEQPFYWPPREIMVGKHVDTKHQERIDDHSDDDVPYEGCCCGIHALTTPLFLTKTGYVSMIGPSRTNFVWGELEMWGKIIEGQTGIKSQFAYPKQFVLRSDVMLKVEGEAGVTMIDAWLIRDLLSAQWGVPAIVGKTAKRKSLDSDEVVFTVCPEPTE